MKRIEQSKKTEDAILDATFQVIDAHTISGTRMQLIAEKSGTSKANLHYHFKTKDDLLLALLDRIEKIFNEDRQSFLDGANNDLESKLLALFQQKKHYFLEKPSFDRAQLDFWIQAQVNESIKNKFNHSYDLWRDDIEAIMHRYVPEASADTVKAAAQMMVSLMLGMSYQYLLDSSNFHVESYIRNSIAAVKALLFSSPRQSSQVLPGSQSVQY